MNYLVKISATKYYSNFIESGVVYDRSIELLDNYTLKLVRTEEADTVYRRYEYILERVGWDTDADLHDNGSGCNAGFGAFVAILIMFPAIKATWRKKV